MQLWIQAACLQLGPLPSRYITFDVETTGFGPDSLLAQIAFLKFEDDKLVDEQTVWVDHVTTMLPDELTRLELKLADVRQKIEGRQGRYNVKYAVSVERMRAGVPPADARTVVAKWLEHARREGVPLAGHNAKFDSKWVSSFLANPQAMDGLAVIDTDVIERAVQAMPPRIEHRSWAEFSKNCSGLGGSKYKSNLSDWCATKYRWHDRQLVNMHEAHEARCDAYLTHLLLQEFKQAAAYGQAV